jgi:signal transduction histidine kinase
MRPPDARGVLIHVIVWGVLVLAGLINLVLPAGASLHLLYALPLLAAAAHWNPRAVSLVAGAGVATDLATDVAQEVPTSVATVGLVTLALVGWLAVHAARLRHTVGEAGRTRDDFVAAAAHDLKNPLTVVHGEAQALQQYVRRLVEQPGSGAAERLATGLTRIDHAALRTLALLNELLDTVRLQAGKTLDLVVHPTDLVALAQRVVAIYQPLTDQHRLIVQAQVPALVGQWDAFRLERVLENLLSNAVKYSTEGEISVSVWQEDHPPASENGRANRMGRSWAVLTVRDQGLGIPAADLPRVFRRFERGGNVAGRLPGSGIGLAGTRRIVEQHGGTISVESVEGVGSTFAVRLPLQSATSLLTPAPPAAAPPAWTPCSRGRSSPSRSR